jgi:hypothetical protein
LLAINEDLKLRKEEEGERRREVSCEDVVGRQ